MAILAALLALVPAADSPSVHARATVWIRAGDRATGTGWVVDARRRLVVTARHVVADRESVDVCFLDHPLGHAITDRRHYVADFADLRRRGLAATGRVILRHENADLALLVLARLPAGTPALPLAEKSARPGDACRSVGHRHDSDLLWTLTAGRVRRVGRLPDGYFWAGRRIGAGVPLVVLQAPVAAGESGSAVVDDSGHVVGVISAVVNQTPGSALAIDVSEIRALLAEARGGPAPARPAPGPGSPAGVDARVLGAATVWMRPRSTDGRAAGVLVDAGRKLVLTSATAVGTEPVVDAVAPRRYLGQLVPEIDAYRDLLGLRLRGTGVAGVVLARDPGRDLALVELDAVPPGLTAVAIAASPPRPGEPVATMSHPTGIDLLWLYAGGTVRAVGPVAVGREWGESPKVRASVLQLPHQDEASGGPVVNASGELIGVVAARGAAGQGLAYAAVPEEIRAFLTTARPLWEPKTAAEWAARGHLMSRLNRFGAALDAFRQAADRAPDHAAGPAGCAAVLAAMGRRDEAGRLADAALARKPSPAILAEVANVFRRIGRADRASELVGQALSLDAQCAPALVVRARLRPDRGAPDDVAEAIRIDPALVAAYRVRAGLRDHTGADGRREALADWGRVLELSPTDVDALRERASLFVAAGEPKKAVGDWSRVTELEPLVSDNWIGLARVRFAAGDRSGAADALRSVLRVDAARVGEVFDVVRALARELEEDNPADHDRVAAWRSVALTRLAAWLPK